MRSENSGQMYAFCKWATLTKENIDPGVVCTAEEAHLNMLQSPSTFEVETKQHENSHIRKLVQTAMEAKHIRVSTLQTDTVISCSLLTGSGS